MENIKKELVKQAVDKMLCRNRIKFISDFRLGMPVHYAIMTNIKDVDGCMICVGKHGRI